MIPGILLDRFSPWFFQGLDERQSRLCILDEGSSQQQSNISVGLVKYEERQCFVAMKNSFIEYIQGLSYELRVTTHAQPLEST